MGYTKRTRLEEVRSRNDIMLQSRYNTLYMKNILSFIDKPKIAIAVFVENSGFGSTWAAPIASLMIEMYLSKEIKGNYRKQLEKKMKLHLKFFLSEVVYQ